MDDFKELKAQLSKVNNKAQAIEFLVTQLSPKIRSLSEVVNPETHQFVDAVGAALDDLPEISANISDECAANFCEILFYALFYE